jgi:hypothetical protein
MKKILTAQEVTDNLQILFPGKDIKCTEVIEGRTKWNEANYFYIETNITKVVIIGKTIWVKPDIRSWARYIIYCKDTGAMYKKVRTAKLGTVIPFIYLPARNSKDAKEQADLLLQACGVKTVKINEDDLSRLRKFKAPFYVECYKMIKQIQVIESTLREEPICDRWGNENGMNFILSVTHTTGNFKFPIDMETEEQKEEVTNIFLNLLGKPVTSKIKELIAA